MRVSLRFGGLYVLFRYADDPRDALGFVIKPASRMLFSERYGGYRHALHLGPVYIRTFARRPIRDLGGAWSALAAATGTAKTPQAVECEASQSGPKGNAQPLSGNPPNDNT